MDARKMIHNEIELLTQAIAETPGDGELYMERGRLYYRRGEFGNAANDFISASELDPRNAEAAQYLDIIREIMEFRHADLLNP